MSAVANGSLLTVDRARASDSSVAARATTERLDSIPTPSCHYTNRAGRKIHRPGGHPVSRSSSGTPTAPAVGRMRASPAAPGGLSQRNRAVDRSVAGRRPRRRLADRGQARHPLRAQRESWAPRAMTAHGTGSPSSRSAESRRSCWCPPRSRRSGSPLVRQKLLGRPLPRGPATPTEAGPTSDGPSLTPVRSSSGAQLSLWSASSPPTGLRLVSQPGPSQPSPGLYGQLRWL